MYQLQFPEKARQFLKRLDPSFSARILRKLNWLAEHAGEIKEEGLRGDMSRFSKIREGDYRILYEIIRKRQIIVVHAIGHRSEIYKK
ncbi:MAG: type II toxin-antitoxin system RelE/ParE family toxin [Pyrinomonadaceae bacterium]|nr:type II toxin-antitoxin system RelE/ParE family toxin [Pyrinomonadaceae bacterium]